MTSEEILLYWINRINHVNYQPGQITFGMPEVNDNPDQPVNTKILATAALGDQVGSMYLYYQRAALNKILPYTRISVPQSVYQSATTVRELYTALAEQHKLIFAAEELEDGPLAAEVSGEKPVTFTAVENSRVLIGQTSFKLARWIDRT
jgi:hypothetical protein